MTQQAVVNYAKAVRCLVSVPSLFLITPPGQTGQLNVKQKVGELVFSFTGPEQLTMVDLEVLIALIALAGVQNDCYTHQKQLSRNNAKIRLGQMHSPRGTPVRTKCSELAREMGRSCGGATWPLIKQSIARLSRVCISAQTIYDDHHRYESMLLKDRTDKSDSAMTLELSPVLISAVLGGPGEFIQIDTEVFRSLKDKSGVACLLYFRMYSFFSGQDHTLSFDRLIELVYGSNAPSTSRRKYRSRVKAAMLLIGARSSWKVQEKKGAGFTFSRPRKMHLNPSPES